MLRYSYKLSLSPQLDVKSIYCRAHERELVWAHIRCYIYKITVKLHTQTFYLQNDLFCIVNNNIISNVSFNDYIFSTRLY